MVTESFKLIVKLRNSNRNHPNHRCEFVCAGNADKSLLKFSLCSDPNAKTMRNFMFIRNPMLTTGFAQS